MMTIGEERYASMAIHALERIAEQLDRLNKNLESARVGSDKTEKTEDKE